MFGFVSSFDVIGAVWAHLKTWLELANHYGLPIPLILVLGFIAFQVRWHEREKYYLDLLRNLGSWRNALRDRLDYYEQPGSEYYDDKITVSETYKELERKSFEAANAIREILPIAKAFLSDKCIQALEGLESEHWHIAEHGSICESDYLGQITPLVQKTYDLVLQETKKDLRKSRVSRFIKALSDRKPS